MLVVDYDGYFTDFSVGPDFTSLALPREKIIGSHLRDIFPIDRARQQPGNNELLAPQAIRKSPCQRFGEGGGDDLQGEQWADRSAAGGRRFGRRSGRERRYRDQRNNLHSRAGNSPR